MENHKQQSSNKGERKEIIQLNGVTVLAVLVVIANFLIIGFYYRYDAHQMYLMTKAHDIEYTGLLHKQHVLHEEIVDLEGAKNWEETNYARATTTSGRPF